MLVRDATEKDLESIFMMGFDVWSDGSTSQEYLDSCFNSEKYKRGQWKVLTDGQRLLSSLIIYPLNKSWFGIGSIATPVKLRNQGWGSKITLEVSKQLESSARTQAIFLFADIKPEFYRNLEFVPLPSEFQEYQSSTCMLRSTDPKNIWSADGFQPPKYF